LSFATASASTRCWPFRFDYVVSFQSSVMSDGQSHN
jgi:hypothetical protein